MDFRSRLREEIEFSGLLDKEVASRAGITKRALDSYVGSQASMPSAEVAVKIAKVLGVSVEYLVTGNETPIMDESVRTKLNYLSHLFLQLDEKDQYTILALAKELNAYNKTNQNNTNQ